MWFPSDQHAVVVVFGFDKAKQGDVWYGRATVEGQANVDEWTRQNPDASARLGLEVNIARVDTRAWEHDDDGFVATVKARPHVSLAIKATVPAGQG